MDHYADADLIHKIVHPDDRDRLDAWFAAPDARPLRLRWVRRDGQTILTEQRIRVLRDTSGEVVAIEGVAREVADPLREEAVLRVGPLTIDRLRQSVRLGGRPVHLTPSEFRLLSLLAERSGAVSRTELSQHLWESDFAGSGRVCEAHI